MTKCVVAVTGHRDVLESIVLKKEIASFFDDILARYDAVTLLSPLAEGADTLVAEIFLQRQADHTHSKLEVPLPLSKVAYMKTFSKAYQKRFVSLLAQADIIFEVPKICEHSFENLGRYMVTHSDVLLALWDGIDNGLQGGTADVVRYAKNLKKPITHIKVTRQNH